MLRVVVLQLLSVLCVATVMQLTSSQPTLDVIQQDNDICSGGRSENFERTVLTVLSQLQSANSQLQKEVAELKAATVPKRTTGKLRNQTSEIRAILRSPVPNSYSCNLGY